jgi:hypothetical protein
MVAEKNSVWRSVVGRKPHIQHPVRLVEHQHLEIGAVHVSAAHVVEQAAGRRDHDVHAALERPGLRLHADAAVDRGSPQPAVAAVSLRAAQNLLRELAGRNQHERSKHPAPAVLESLENGEEKSGGLAGAGLG